MHPARRKLVWSPLNDPPTIVDATAGVLSWGRRRRVLLYGAGYGAGAAQDMLNHPAWMVWTCNLIVPQDAQGRVRADVWFDLHQHHAQTADDLAWIRDVHVPIYVPDDLASAGPNCVRFPVEEMERLFGAAYWTCTFAYQIALALSLGVTDIALYGIDLAFGTRRERTVEWAGTSWWLGYAAARGVTIHVPRGSRMGQHTHRYGLEYDAEKRDVEHYIEMMWQPGNPD